MDAPDPQHVINLDEEWTKHMIPTLKSQGWFGHVTAASPCSPSPTSLPTFSMLSDAGEAYQHIVTQQQQKMETRRYSLMKELKSLKQGDNKVDEFYGQFVRLWCELDELDHHFCLSSCCEGCFTCSNAPQARRDKERHDKERLYDFFNNLRPELESLCEKLVPRSLAIAEVVSALQVEEARLCSTSEQPRDNKDGDNKDDQHELQLHAAVMNNDTKLAESLLKENLVDSRNAWGKTPLHMALSNGALSCVRLLEEYGADWYAEDNEGNTAFHVAAYAMQSGGVLRFCRDQLLFLKVLPRLTPAAKSKKNNRGETPQDIIKMVPKDFIGKEVGDGLLSWGVDPSMGVHPGICGSCRMGVHFGTCVAHLTVPEKQIELSNLTKSRLLIDATLAGTTESNKCTLILTEGKTARLFVSDGIDRLLGHDKFGVYSLTGKPSNVQNKLSIAFHHIMSILGLEIGKHEAINKDLRYGSVILMMDQDEDGSHMKALLINFFLKYFPSLLRLPGFIQDFPTPILMGENKRMCQVKLFKSLNEYDLWRHTVALDGWSFKYFKGLGSNSPQAATEYFQKFKSNVRYFHWSGDCDQNYFDIAFDTEKISEKRRWISDYDTRTTPVPILSTQLISYTSFAKKELRPYLIADIQRSIPCAIDGLKETQRKAVFVHLEKLKLNDNSETVAALSGQIIEHSSYHHRRDSMETVIINMARSFVGSLNNLNLFQPDGAFGTRSDPEPGSASYIRATFSPLTRLLFPQDDYINLERVHQHGRFVEPKMYVPIVPLVLINGGNGVAAGYNYKCPSYHPIEVIDNLKRLMDKKQPQPMEPWYRDFKGTVQLINATEHCTVGLFEVNGTSVNILEIPVNTTYKKYEKFLAVLKTKNLIKDYEKKGTADCSQFKVTLLKALPRETIEFKLKLRKKIKSTFIFLDSKGNAVPFGSAEEVLSYFFEERLKWYTRRKNRLIQRTRQRVQGLDPLHKDIQELESLESERQLEYEIRTWRKELFKLEQGIRDHYAKLGYSLERKNWVAQGPSSTGRARVRSKRGQMAFSAPE